MTAHTRAAFAVALTWLCGWLCGCDGNVLVGYGPDAEMPAQPAAGNGGSGGMTMSDAGKKPVPNDAAVGVGTRDAAPPAKDAGHTIDATVVEDAGNVEQPPAAVTWLSGAHAGNDYQEYVDYGDWRGRPLGIAALYADRTGWNTLEMPGWPFDMFAPFAGRVLFSVPLYPEGMGTNQECASGAYDDHWKALGSFLVDKDRADTILRLGWGPNDTDHPWRADADPADWIECFRHVVTAVRSTDPEIEIDWSVNPVGNPTIAAGDPFLTYPGDDYVDYVGLEVFDEYPPTPDQASWDQKCQSPSGLCSLAAFARSHDKQIGLGEWGSVACGADPGGDSRFFMRKMFDFFAANADILGYESYFEDTGGDVCSALKADTAELPEAATLYQELYGPR